MAEMRLYLIKIDLKPAPFSFTGALHLLFSIGEVTFPLSKPQGSVHFLMYRASKLCSPSLAE